MHNVVIRKAFIRNGSNKASSSIWSCGDLAAGWKSEKQLVTYVAPPATPKPVELHASHQRMAISHYKLASPTTPKHVELEMELSRLENGHFKIRNASFEPNFSQTQPKLFWREISLEFSKLIFKIPIFEFNFQNFNFQIVFFKLPFSNKISKFLFFYLIFQNSNFLDFPKFHSRNNFPKFQFLNLIFRNFNFQI